MSQVQDILIARLGEIALKGLNRGKFEQRLISNLARRLKPLGSFQIHQSQSLIRIEPVSEQADLDAALELCCKVFGLVSVSKVKRAEVKEEDLLPFAYRYMKEKLEQEPPRSGKKWKFKVEAKRGNKKFPLTSPEISSQIGAHLLKHFHHSLEVDVHQPDFILQVEVRDYFYLFCDKHEGLRGLPVGMSSKALLLLSGGIDSPVAGFQMASRGVEVEAIYFHTPPYTSERAKQKVRDLAEILSHYTGRLHLACCDFTDIQLKINEHCPQELITILMRRMMMRIANAFAKQRSCLALITGESLGQVASQTMEALCTTDAVVDIPVFRPLIGIDKEDTIKLAKKIGSFETSIQPYEDCCTVFVAKHPKTRPNMQEVFKAEENLDIVSLVEEGLQKITLETFRLI